MHKIENRRSELVSDFCDFFQIFPVQTDPVLMQFLTCRTFSWCSHPVPGTASRSGIDRHREPMEATPPGVIWQARAKQITNNKPAGDNPGTDREQLRNSQNQKPILTERCKMRLKTFLRNHGKIYRKHIKHA